MPYAVAADVIDRWIGQSPPPADQVTLHIADATTLIDREFPDLSPGDDGQPTNDEVRLVVVKMVTRLYRNPEGIASRSIGGPDEFGGSVSYSGSNPGELVITADERAILSGPALAGAGSRAFTINPTPVQENGPGYIGACDPLWDTWT